jgi:hypothetical protein
VRPVVQTGQPIPSSNGVAFAGAQGTDIGNVGRNVLRGPRQINVDFSIIRRFPFGEAKSIEFRAEFFNLFNQVNFDNPNGNLNAALVNSTTADHESRRFWPHHVYEQQPAVDPTRFEAQFLTVLGPQQAKAPIAIKPSKTTIVTVLAQI